MIYPDHMHVRIVRPSGQLHWRGGDYYISETLIGEPVALEPVDDRYYDLYYGPVVIARYDDKTKNIIKPKPKKRKRR